MRPSRFRLKHMTTIMEHRLAVIDCISNCPWPVRTIRGPAVVGAAQALRTSQVMLPCHAKSRPGFSWLATGFGKFVDVDVVDEEKSCSRGKNGGLAGLALVSL